MNWPLALGIAGLVAAFSLGFGWLVGAYQMRNENSKPCDQDK